MKIVIFGGTFNPIHNGHVRVVSYIHDKLKPDRLILMPDHIPPHKPADSLAAGKEDVVESLFQQVRIHFPPSFDDTGRPGGKGLRHDFPDDGR